MAAWEYQVICLGIASDSAGDMDWEQTRLTEQGSNGWELVSVVHAESRLFAYMKRALTIETED